jgi:hypothetical protein
MNCSPPWLARRYTSGDDSTYPTPIPVETIPATALPDPLPYSDHPIVKRIQIVQRAATGGFDKPLITKCLLNYA